MNVAFWADMTKVLGTIIVKLQAQQPQKHQPGSTHSIKKGGRENYNEYALAVLMGYANIFNTSDIPRIQGKLQNSKELADNMQ